MAHSSMVEHRFLVPNVPGSSPGEPAKRTVAGAVDRNGLENRQRQ